MSVIFRDKISCHWVRGSLTEEEKEGQMQAWLVNRA